MVTLEMPINFEDKGIKQGIQCRPFVILYIYFYISLRLLSPFEMHLSSQKLRTKGKVRLCVNV